MTMTLSGSGTIGGLVAGGLPDATIVQADLASGVAGNGPAFSAYQSSAQTVSGSTFSKVQFQTKEFDTASCFDSSTNYRFTPNVAGYYQISTTVTCSNSRCALVSIYKNGSGFKNSGQVDGTYATYGSTVSALVYFNGTTDYVECYVYATDSLPLVAANTSTYFQGCLVRAA